jgi:ribosomal protein S6--L-glutamate ligase
MIRIGIVTVRDRSYHPNRRLLEAVHAYGHRGLLIHPYRLWAVTQAGRLSVTAARAVDLPHVVLPRQGAEIGDTCLALLHQFQLMGIPLVNGLRAVMTARNKFLTQQTLSAAGLPCPDAIFVNDASGLPHAVERLGGYPVVVKPVSGRQGSGVRRITDAAAMARQAVSLLTPPNGVVVQRYVSTRSRRDVRVLIIGGELVCAVTLTPAADEFRANFHLGGQIRPAALDADTKQIAVDAAAAVGCDIAGVDIMIDGSGQPYIVEVNYSPGFRGLEAASGLDIAGRMIQFTTDCYERKIR